MKFRKKPVIIEAVQYKGGITKELENFISDCGRNVTFKPGIMIIETLEGDMIANKNDWIIKGVKGELYPCKPDIFEQTYEEVTE